MVQFQDTGAMRRGGNQTQPCLTVDPNLDRSVCALTFVPTVISPRVLHSPLLKALLSSFLLRERRQRESLTKESQRQKERDRDRKRETEREREIERQR